MSELKCPHCGKVFTVDDTALSSIVQQIRDAEFEKEIEKRVKEMQKRESDRHELELRFTETEIKMKVKEESDKEIEKIRKELKKAEAKTKDLEREVQSAEDKKKLAVMEAVLQWRYTLRQLMRRIRKLSFIRI